MSTGLGEVFHYLLVPRGMSLTDAKTYLDAAFKSEQIDAKSYRTLSVQIDQGYRKEQGTTQGDRIFATRGGPSQSDPGSVIDWVIGVEGGYVANDAGKGPTKFGINGKANGLSPEQVANLTMDQARAIYKKNYWDKIGADKLAPDNLNFPHWANLSLGGAVGVCAGVLTVGISLVGIGMTHSSRDLLGVVGAARSNNAKGQPKTDSTALWIPIDRKSTRLNSSHRT